MNRVPGLVRNCGGEPSDAPTALPLHDVTCTDASELVAFTPAYGPTTPAGPGVEVVLGPDRVVRAVAQSRGHDARRRPDLPAGHRGDGRTAGHGRGRRPPRRTRPPRGRLRRDPPHPRRDHGRQRRAAAWCATVRSRSPSGGTAWCIRASRASPTAGSSGATRAPSPASTPGAGPCWSPSTAVRPTTSGSASPKPPTWPAPSAWSTRSTSTAGAPPRSPWTGSWPPTLRHHRRAPRG